MLFMTVQFIYPGEVQKQQITDNVTVH